MAEMEAAVRARIAEQKRNTAASVAAARQATANAKVRTCLSGASWFFENKAEYNKDDARLRAAARKRKAPRRGFISREKTPADFDQPIKCC